MNHRMQRAWGVALLLGMTACAAAIVAGCDEDGVTAKCDPQPIVDENGQTVNASGEPVDSKWNDPELGAGGALNRWALANPDCATLPVAGSSGN